MPAFETMFVELIVKLREPGVLDESRTLLEANASLIDVLNALDVIPNPGQAEFIASTPTSIQAAILAAVRDNLKRDQPKQMMFNWVAGYDWELRLTESQSSIMSEGGITIQVRSRYPGDPHPGTGS